MKPGRKQFWLAVSFAVWTWLVYEGKIDGSAYSMLMMPTVVAYLGVREWGKKNGVDSSQS